MTREPELSRFSHREIHQRARFAYQWYNPRSVDLTGGATRTTLGTYPDAADAIILADAATDGFATVFWMPDDAMLGEYFQMVTYYSMNASGAGDVVFRTTVLEWTGSNAASAAGTSTSDTVTPGPGTDVKSFTRETLYKPTVLNRPLRVTFERLGSNGSDTHTGNVRVVGCLVKYKRKNDVL